MKRLDLDVSIDPKAGFCFGVRQAIKKAEDLLEQGAEVTCLGQIVHNQVEINRLSSLGMKTAEHSDMELIRNRTVLIRSHGEPPSTYRKLEENGNTLIEATCPIVKKLQDRVEEDHHNGEYIIVFGKKEHPEVIGVIGRMKDNFQVAKSVDELDPAALPNQVTLFSQTTMDLDAFREVHSFLVENGKEVKLRDTICRKVSGKKDWLHGFAGSHDVIIMVAGEKSSNGRVLFDICREANSRSYKVENISQIDKDWFRPGEKIGITGATSTPQWQMEQVKNLIEKY